MRAVTIWEDRAMRARAYASSLLAAVVLAGCGGGGDGDGSPEGTVDPAEMETAVATIIDNCIEISRSNGADRRLRADISLAVDDLIRNYQASSPDAKLDFGDLKVKTPRKALEETVPFLERCSPDDADRVNEARLSSNP